MKHLTDDEIKQIYRRLFPRGAYILDESVVLFGQKILEAAQASIEVAVTAEREECAKVVDEMEKQRCEAWHQVLTKGGEVPSMSLAACAAAIRARGQA